MVLTETLLLNFFGVAVATVVFVLLFFKWKYSYWKNLGVVYQEPTIPFGNSADNFLHRKSIGETSAEFYSFLKSKKVKHGGSYLLHAPIYVPVDLDLIKRILQRHFINFTDHGAYVNENDDPLTAHLFSLQGQRWRIVRTELSTTFTAGTMKNMFPIMVTISEELAKVLEQQCKESKPVEAKDMSARFTTDIIGSCAFGLDCNSLQDPHADFRVQGRRLFSLTESEIWTSFLCFLFPGFMKLLKARVLPKAAADFFWSVVEETTKYREKNDIKRDDVLQLLMGMRNKDGKQNPATLSFKEMAAHAFVFFIAGFETSSTLMSFALLELAMNEDVQNKLREEINLILDEREGEFTHEGFAKMKYLDMVINETLRKYPPLPTLNRVCTSDYSVPDTDIVIKKGVKVFIPVRGIHYDPEYYPDPQKFDPTRFNEQNKRERHPFAFLPFGEGPRICIGFRFGVMQAKVGLASIIKDFKIKVNPKTTLPVKLDPKSFLTSAAGGLWMDLERINSS